MRIGLYGMPTAGKTTILKQIDFLPVLHGSTSLHELAPNFSMLNEKDKKLVRLAFAKNCHKFDDLVMDGHYAFGDQVVFTESDGDLYDCFLYLYVHPDILRERMQRAEKNHKYLQYDISAWQDLEVEKLREYCHKHDKDFYVLDCQPGNMSVQTDIAVSFIRTIYNGYSNISFARKIVKQILSKAKTKTITLLDGDKTLIREDSSYLAFQYQTHIFDGIFYTGFQTWMQYLEFESYRIDPTCLPKVHRNEKLPQMFHGDAFILSAGNNVIWQTIAKHFGMTVFSGSAMSSDTKYFVTKFLRAQGYQVFAYGDSMGDYYMLKEADKGFLMTKPDGTISRSLKGKNMEGIQYV